MHKTLFRVHASRLARYCVYFQKLFESCTASSAGQNETIDGCPVYHVPAELSPNQFKDVLRALDTPLYVSSVLYLSSVFVLCVFIADLHRVAIRREFTSNPCPCVPAHLGVDPAERLTLGTVEMR